MDIIIALKRLHYSSSLTSIFVDVYEIDIDGFDSLSVLDGMRVPVTGTVSCLAIRQSFIPSISIWIDSPHSRYYSIEQIAVSE